MVFDEFGVIKFEDLGGTLRNNLPPLKKLLLECKLFIIDAGGWLPGWLIGWLVGWLAAARYLAEKMMDHGWLLLAGMED